MKATHYFLILFLLYNSSVAATLSPTEKQIQHTIQKQKKAELDFLEKVVNINSGTTNIAGVRRVGEIFRMEFKKLGFKTKWVEEPANMHRAGTLLAERKGTNGKRILLIGHLDTVFSKKSSFQKFKRRGARAIGPGIVDDKGGDVVILYALKALFAAHALDNTNITVALMGDEEDSGKPTSISRKALIAAAKKSDAALDFELSFDLDTATIARRGVSQWTIETKGQENHSAEIFKPDAGYGAIFEMVRILNILRTELAEEKYASFNPGLILGGTKIQIDASEGNAYGKSNVIAKTAMAKGDLRFLTAEQKQSLEKRMSDIVSRHLTGTFAKILFQDGIPAMPPTENNLQLLQKYSQVSIDLGYGPVKPLEPGLRGAGDISHVAAIVPFNIAGLGPVGSGPHSTNETLDISSLPIATARAALLIYRLSHS